MAEQINQEAVQETNEQTTQAEPEVVQDMPTNAETQKVADEPQGKTYTEEDLQKLVQSMTDKRVTEALKTAKGKWESEYQSKLEAEKAEAERLAKLTAKERQEEEIKKMQQNIDIERAEFEKQREEFMHEKLTLATVKNLNEKHLPVEFADFLVGSNEEVTNLNIEKFELQWNTLLQKSIEQHVQQRLQTNKQPTQAPKAEAKVMTKKEFANLPYAERRKMMNENPDLVKEILGQ